MATKEDKDKGLLEAQHMAAWHACLAIEKALQTSDNAFSTGMLMQAAFNAGKAIAIYRTRNNS